MDKLKPCPFCGEDDAEAYGRDTGTAIVWMTKCLCCHCDGPVGDDLSEKAAIAAWNNRLGENE